MKILEWLRFQKWQSACNASKFQLFLLYNSLYILIILSCIRPDDVISHIVMSDGPSLNNVTVAADVRFHDDVKTYTGVKAVSK